MAAKYTVIKHKVKKMDAEGNPIKNEKGNFVWEEVEKSYRVDAGFKPEAIEEICAEFIAIRIFAVLNSSRVIVFPNKLSTFKYNIIPIIPAIIPIIV